IMPRVRLEKLKRPPPVCLISGASEGVRYERVEFIYKLPERLDLVLGDVDMTDRVLSKTLLYIRNSLAGGWRARVERMTLPRPFAQPAFEAWRRTRARRWWAGALARALVLAAILVSIFGTWRTPAALFWAPLGAG